MRLCVKAPVYILDWPLRSIDIRKNTRLFANETEGFLAHLLLVCRDESLDTIVVR